MFHKLLICQPATRLEQNVPDLYGEALYICMAVVRQAIGDHQITYISSPANIQGLLLLGNAQMTSQPTAGLELVQA
jgi:hypothetical protein